MLSDGSTGGSFCRFLQVSGLRDFADITQPLNSRIARLQLVKTGTDVDLIEHATSFRAAVPLKYIKDSAGYYDFDAYRDIFVKGKSIVDTDIYIYNASRLDTTNLPF